MNHSLISLKSLNTFGLDVHATELLTIQSEQDVLALLPRLQKKDFLILGGGSNILFTQDYQGLVVLNRIKGIELIAQNKEELIVEVGAGEVWHEFVLHTLAHNWYGLENLSLIPGTVGASPIQNIGAYGVEIVDLMDSVDFIDLESGKKITLANAACNFGYRDSIFKNELKGKFIITKVRFKLSAKANLKLEYGAIKDVLAEKGIQNPSPKDVSNAVIHIRSTKLPNPAEIGNCGSFFKNPVVSLDVFEDLKTRFPAIPSFAAQDGNIKIPAAWLIDQAGWKGKTFGNIGVHKNQALVLVNYGGGNGLEIKNLAFDIIDSVKQMYGIKLSAEVNILGSK